MPCSFTKSTRPSRWAGTMSAGSFGAWPWSWSSVSRALLARCALLSAMSSSPMGGVGFAWTRTGRRQRGEPAALDRLCDRTRVVLQDGRATRLTQDEATAHGRLEDGLIRQEADAIPGALDGHARVAVHHLGGEAGHALDDQIPVGHHQERGSRGVLRGGGVLPRAHGPPEVGVPEEVVLAILPVRTAIAVHDLPEDPLPGGAGVDDRVGFVVVRTLFVERQPSRDGPVPHLAVRRHVRLVPLDDVGARRVRAQRRRGRSATIQGGQRVVDAVPQDRGAVAGRRGTDGPLIEGDRQGVHGLALSLRQELLATFHVPAQVLLRELP